MVGVDPGDRGDRDDPGGHVVDTADTDDTDGHTSVSLTAIAGRSVSAYRLSVSPAMSI